jgi:hypothetical protein
MKKVFAILVVAISIIGLSFTNDTTFSKNTPSVSSSFESPVLSFEGDTTIAELSEEMEKQGKIMEAHGKVMEKHGKEMEKLGKQMENARLKDLDEYGREMDKLGKVMDSLGRIMDRHGKIMDKLGKKMDAAHKKMNNWLFRELKKDGLIPSLDGKVSLLFENDMMRVNGKDVPADLQAKYKRELTRFWGKPLKPDASLYIKGTISEDADGNIDFNGNYNTSL